MLINYLPIFKLEIEHHFLSNNKQIQTVNIETTHHGTIKESQGLHKDKRCVESNNEL